jgi:hypothetical protein
LEVSHVDTKGALFDPELIELIKTAFEEATAMLPVSKRTSSIKAEIASSILACAAKGERDPAAQGLRVAEACSTSK